MKYRSVTITKALLLLLVAMVGVGCSATAHIEKDDSVNFEKIKTYSWISEQEKSVEDRNSNNIVDAKLKEVVNSELQAKGWRQSKLNPDVLLDYNIVVEQTVRNDERPVYSQSHVRYFYNPYSRRIVPFYYPSQLMGYERNEIPVREGTITLHMIDADNNKLIWQGWASDVVTSKNMTSKEVNRSVKSIMKKFRKNE